MGDQFGNMSAHNAGARNAKHPFGCRIGEQHRSVIIGCDHTIQGRFDDQIGFRLRVFYPAQMTLERAVTVSAGGDEKANRQDTQHTEASGLPASLAGGVRVDLREKVSLLTTDSRQAESNLFKVGQTSLTIWNGKWVHSLFAQVHLRLHDSSLPECDVLLDVLNRRQLLR